MLLAYLSNGLPDLGPKALVGAHEPDRLIDHLGTAPPNPKASVNPETVCSLEPPKISKTLELLNS